MFRSVWRVNRVMATPSRLHVALPMRHFSVSPVKFASLFGEVTETKEQPKEELTDVNPADITPANDTKLQEFHMAEAKKEHVTAEKYVAPLKRKLFALNVEQNGFFKNGQFVTDPDTNKTYKVTLTPDEIDVLEPTVYIQSYRLKSLMKKATLVNRFVRGCTVKSAINQLHFNPKKMATELEKLLKRGLEQARDRGYDVDSLYIQALWTGSDGKWVKRPDIKGRGRTGILEHPYVHIKAILKTQQTLRRREWEKEQERLARKPRMFLNNEPLNFRVKPFYRW